MGKQPRKTITEDFLLYSEGGEMVVNSLTHMKPLNLTNKEGSFVCRILNIEVHNHMAMTDEKQILPVNLRVTFDAIQLTEDQIDRHKAQEKLVLPDHVKQSLDAEIASNVPDEFKIPDVRVEGE